MRGDMIMCPGGAGRGASSILHAIERIAAGARNDIVAVQVEEVK